MIVRGAPFTPGPTTIDRVTPHNGNSIMQVIPGKLLWPRYMGNQPNRYWKPNKRYFNELTHINDKVAQPDTKIVFWLHIHTSMHRWNGSYAFNDQVATDLEQWWECPGGDLYEAVNHIATYTTGDLEFIKSIAANMADGIYTEQSPTNSLHCMLGIGPASL